MSKKYAQAEAMIVKCLDDIWVKYDKDDNGTLDKEETKAFVMEFLSEMKQGGNFNVDEFEECFLEFDKD